MIDILVTVCLSHDSVAIDQTVLFFGLHSKTTFNINGHGFVTFLYNAGPILSAADIVNEEECKQQNMFETATPPKGSRLLV